MHLVLTFHAVFRAECVSVVVPTSFMCIQMHDCVILGSAEVLNLNTGCIFAILKRALSCLSMSKSKN